MENLTLALQHLPPLLKETILIVDDKKNILYANKPYSDDFALEKNLLVSAAPSDGCVQTYQLTDVFYQKIFAHPSEPEPYQTSFINHNNEKITFEWRSFLLPSATKQTCDIILLMGRDISNECHQNIQIHDLETRLQRSILEEQEKFARLARKVAHDINSPLAALRVLSDMCQELSEDKRGLLKNAVDSILDISNHLIANYRVEEPVSSLTVEPREQLLISDLLVQLVSEKKMEYRDHRGLRIEIGIEEGAHFAFAYIQKSELRRAISNLINNAVEALDTQQKGDILVHLGVLNNSLTITIQDNGCGMPNYLVKKIQRQKGFTQDKTTGPCLGLQQVWDMLSSNQASMNVTSTTDKGTTIQLILPKIIAANWIAQHIHLGANSLIVILDDEASIHHAWDMRLTPILATHPEMRLHHFTQGKEALDFFHSLTPLQKLRVHFLSDYELIGEAHNGLDIIEQSKVGQAILVTSHYHNPTVRMTANKFDIKILPKHMAAVVPIIIGINNAIFK